MAHTPYGYPHPDPEPAPKASKKPAVSTTKGKPRSASKKPAKTKQAASDAPATE